MEWQTSQIGIIGAGHLGLALAKRLLACGFDADRLLISHRGDAGTRDRLKLAGLENRITTNPELAQKSDLVILAMKPSDMNSLSKLVFNKNAMIVSAVAGLGTGYLTRYLQHDVIRIMPSSPLTIEAGTAVAAVFPTASQVIDFLACLNFRIYRMPAEEIFHLFTATVCLAAAFLYLRLQQRTYDETEIVNRFRNEYDRFPEIYEWVKRDTPVLLETAEIDAYLRRMTTKGGITERILESLQNGDSLLTALEAGINRNREIAASFAQSLPRDSRKAVAEGMTL